MNRDRSWAVGLAAALALAGCRGGKDVAREEPARPTAASPAPQVKGAEWAEPVLYARDGSVVPLSPTSPGTARSDGVERTHAPIHGIQPREESRMQLLDLYQKVVDEKESLAQEVRVLETLLSESRSAQAAAEAERDEQRVRIGGLEEQLSQIEADRADLAARLTTAQIRRLEAEKLLLEFRLAVAQPQADKGDPGRKEADAKKVREAASDKASAAPTSSQPPAASAQKNGAQPASSVDPKGHP